MPQPPCQKTPLYSSKAMREGALPLPLPPARSRVMDCNSPPPRPKQRSRPEEIANNFCPLAPEGSVQA